MPSDAREDQARASDWTSAPGMEASRGRTIDRDAANRIRFGTANRGRLTMRAIAARVLDPAHLELTELRRLHRRRTLARRPSPLRRGAGRRSASAHRPALSRRLGERQASPRPLPTRGRGLAAPAFFPRGRLDGRQQGHGGRRRRRLRQHRPLPGVLGHWRGGGELSPTARRHLARAGGGRGGGCGLGPRPRRELRW